jgi:hypothetical protein
MILLHGESYSGRFTVKKSLLKQIKYNVRQCISGEIEYSLLKTL